MSQPKVNIARNVEQVRQRIAAACARSGRKPEEVTIVAVSKTFPPEAIEEVVRAGIPDIGENRVQEAYAKFQTLGRCATWHLVGHLQTNKVKRALEIFDWIHSVDSLRLAQEISRRAAQSGRDEVNVLLEVNTSGEASKYGVKPEEVLSLAKEVVRLPRLRLQGLMTLAPVVEDPEDARPYFATLRQLRDELIRAGIVDHLPHLSMGMTDDFEVAVEEGATMVRIGRAIFGERDAAP
ncbi:MAG: YggS family pyridoxal phosphate-dependent enzyme [candidate division KSB1 bacterium]|nr:YggS family pyridoxal phosphate-dependent enzyme [candidate division KSB1 bacterium]